MLSRPLGQVTADKTRSEPDSAAGQFFNVPSSNIQIYCPSWVKIDKSDFKLIPVCKSPKAYLGLTNFTSQKSEVNLVACNLETLRNEQDNDEIIGSIKDYLERNASKTAL